MRCLVLMGNIGAGKSTVARMLEADGWCRIVIDDFRRLSPKSQADSGGVEQEYLARNAMLDEIHRMRGDFVYETTAANLIHAKAMLAIESKRCKVIRVLLNISEAESKRRVDARGVASPFKKSHAESFGYIAGALRREWADMVLDADVMKESVIFEKIKELL